MVYPGWARKIEVCVPMAAKRLVLSASLMLFAAVLAGCESQVDVRGNLPDPEAVNLIKPGQSTRAQVETNLGTPSTIATFDKETWYYIGGRVKSVSFFRPELLERKVVVVRFNERGVVEDLRQLDADDGKDVAVVQRETPTKGRELTLLQQLIGNIGRFGGDQRQPADQNTGGP